MNAAAITDLKTEKITMHAENNVIANYSFHNVYLHNILYRTFFYRTVISKKKELNKYKKGCCWRPKGHLFYTFLVS